MSRKSNTDARRRQIVLAMQKVMAQSGYAGATIQAIAAQAGLSPGLVHYHFQDKREILVELVATLEGYARARYAARVADAKTPLERLRAYIDARLAHGADAQLDAVTAWVMVGAEAVRDTDVQEVYQRSVSQELALIKVLLKACSPDLSRRSRRLGDLAAALLAFNEGIFALASNASDVVRVGFAADMAMELMERCIATERKRSSNDADRPRKAPLSRSRK